MNFWVLLRSQIYGSMQCPNPEGTGCVMLGGGARLRALLQVAQTCLLEVLQEEPTFDHQHFQDVKAEEGGSRLSPSQKVSCPHCMKQ